MRLSSSVQPSHFRLLRHQLERSVWLLWMYPALVCCAEVLIALHLPQAGLVLLGAVVGLLASHTALVTPGVLHRFLLSLSIVPMIRLISMTLPLFQLPQLAWYPIVILVMLLHAWMLIRTLGLQPVQLGLRLNDTGLQLAVAGGGIGLGALGYIIFQPVAMFDPATAPLLWLVMLVLFLCMGFDEELIFRGLLQTTATPVLGAWSFVYVSVLFAILHIGYLSGPYIVFAFGVALFFGQIVRQSGSIAGVALSRGLLNVTMLLVMPYIVQVPHAPLVQLAPFIIGAGICLFVLSAALMTHRFVQQRRATTVIDS